MGGGSSQTPGGPPAGAFNDPDTNAAINAQYAALGQTNPALTEEQYAAQHGGPDPDYLQDWYSGNYQQTWYPGGGNFQTQPPQPSDPTPTPSGSEIFLQGAPNPTPAAPPAQAAPTPATPPPSGPPMLVGTPFTGIAEQINQPSFNASTPPPALPDRAIPLPISTPLPGTNSNLPDQVSPMVQALQGTPTPATPTWGPWNQPWSQPIWNSWDPAFQNWAAQNNVNNTIGGKPGGVPPMQQFNSGL